ncbi:MAG: peroxiredoxin family protein [Anaerolineae bacterium]|nr:peroxiredoxin family protein [Anaerolineae bacterium]
MQQVLIVSSILLWVLVLFNMLLTLALVRRVNPSNQNKLEKLALGSPMPNFSAVTLDGTTKSAIDYVDSIVAFVFISSQCNPCRDEIPNLEALGPKAKAAGIDLVLVSIENIEQTRILVDELDITLPVLIAPRGENSFADDYKIKGTPIYCMVKEGAIYSMGLMDKEWETITNEWEVVSKAKGAATLLTLATSD